MYAHWVLTALLVWPLVAAAVIWIAPERAAKHLALAASLVEFALSVPLWWIFVPAAGMQLVQTFAWIPGWGISYKVGVDGISLFLVLLTTFLVPLSVLGSYSYITKRERSFYALLLVLTTGMIGVFVALDLFFFYVMWEVMLIPMYFIIGVWGGDGRLRDPGRHPAEDGDVRVPALRAAVLPHGRPASDGHDRHRHAVAHRDHLRRPGRDGAARLQEAHRVFVGRAPRLRDARHLGPHAAERAGGPAGDDQPRHLDGGAGLSRGHAVRAPAQPLGRGLRRDRQGRAAARRHPHRGLPLRHRAARHERLRRRVPGAARRVPDPPGGRDHRGRRRDRRRDVPPGRAAARDLQPARQAREREPARSDAAGAGRPDPAARRDRVDRRVSEADSRADGAGRTAVHAVRAARGDGGPGHRRGWGGGARLGLEGPTPPSRPAAASRRRRLARSRHPRVL